MSRELSAALHSPSWYRGANDVRKVCVFGSFNFDMVAGVDRFPVPGESLVACGSMTSAGGKGRTSHRRAKSGSKCPLYRQDWQ